MTRDREAELRDALRALPATEVLRLLQTSSASAPEPDDIDEPELREQAIAVAARLRTVYREVQRERVGTAVVSRKRGQRVLGPYPERAGWRVIVVDEKGKKDKQIFATERRAQRFVDMLRAELERDDRTTETALADYKRYLEDDKGNKKDSARQTCSLIVALFGEPISLALLDTKRIEAFYAAMRAIKRKTGEPRFSVDSHRSALIQTRTFLEWCVGKGWIKENPAVGVKGVGKRRPRGKSLGKAGNELRIKQTRAWYQMALYRAHRGDQGAIAALVELLLGPRPSEIVSRRVADVDEDQAPCDLLWIPDSKTPAGRRTLEVPEVLRPYLQKCCEGKRPDQYLFETADGGPHWRDWIIHNVHRICDLAEVPHVTAYYMRGQLATITSERGLAGHLLAEHLGHTDEQMAQRAYAAPGARAKGVQRRGLAVLEGGLKKQA